MTNGACAAKTNATHKTNAKIKNMYMGYALSMNAHETATADAENRSDETHYCFQKATKKELVYNEQHNINTRFK